jgi:hypothetical protein
MKLLNQIKLMILLGLVLVFAGSCQKDPYKGVESNEKSIEAFTLGNGLVQIGPAEIDRSAGTVKVKVLMQTGTDLSKVSPAIQTSYKASVSPLSGQVINFSGNSNTAAYTVTAESGQSRTWTVELVPFTETITGTYAIQAMVVYGGTGPEWGGGGVIKMTDKPWVWPADGGPQAEMDNSLVFELTGATADGNTYGKFTNNAGADGKYADFIFSGTPKTDVNAKYRVLPKGEGEWTRNYAANTLTFKFSDGSTKVATFRSGPYTYTDDYTGSGNKKDIYKKTVNAGINSLEFTLTSVDDWGNIYSDYDKFVKSTRRFWIDIKKN